MTAELDHMLGPVVSIMRRAPPTAHCPECRQAGVFENAMKLRELDELVRLRCVNVWVAHAVFANVFLLYANAIANASPCTVAPLQHIFRPLSNITHNHPLNFQAPS